MSRKLLSLHQIFRHRLGPWVALALLLVVWRCGYFEEKPAAGPAPGTFQLVEAHDGDTLTLAGEQGRHKVRLYGVDAPELRQDYGRRSLNNLNALARGATLRVEGKEVDAYGRLVARVFVEGGPELAAAQLESGLAWVYARYCHDAVCREWRELESEARQRAEGLWRDPRPEPPWQYRQSRE